MRHKFLEILEREIELSLTDDYKGVSIDGIFKAVDLIMNEIEEKQKIKYPNIDEISKWTIILPREATKFDIYQAGVKDCIDYIYRTNQ